ncbi:MAG: glycosyltransferase [Planctomycetota bacterium]|nr:MAG: glycosyltransferase [Planctomycetota bacterium]REK43374.1 MAG: glycosyltransferase [Planctomycetota bacterium]
MSSPNIGFLSTRFAGNDGVSLEAAKWAKILWDHRIVSHWYAGKLDRDPNVSMLVPEAYFYDRDNVWINEQIYGVRQRGTEVTKKIYELAEYLKETIYEFVDRFGIDILIVQNALCIPMHVPLGIALTHYIAETGIPTIAHHHDFYWERSRFAVNAIGDMLAMAFPPSLPAIQHVTINSFAQQDLSWRKGESSVLVPNVLDFEGTPPVADEYSQQLRHEIGLAEDDILILQPTRVVPRKGIEHSISLVAQLRTPKCKLVVSHESGDEGDEYLQALTDLAEQEGVELHFIHTRMGEVRTTDAEGRKTYTLADAYAVADFITYPSLYEGFGNALLEAFFFRKPVLVNRYSIFVADIEPKGFEVIKMDGYLTRDVVDEVQKVLNDAGYREAMVEHNYELCKAFFSYSVLRRKLRALVTNFTGLEEL